MCMSVSPRLNNMYKIAFFFSSFIKSNMKAKCSDQDKENDIKFIFHLGVTRNYNTNNI